MGQKNPRRDESERENKMARARRAILAPRGEYLLCAAALRTNPKDFNTQLGADYLSQPNPLATTPKIVATLAI